MKRHYYSILSACEKHVDYILKNQICDQSSPNFGAIRTVAYDIIDAKSGVDAMLNMASVFYNKESRYYGDKRVYDGMLNALQFTETVQRPDGTLDAIDCNFFSAPDTAFGLHRLVYAYRIIDHYGQDQKSKYLKEKLYNIIVSLAKGVQHGGIHTPNHRWVVASALMACYNMTKIAAFKDKAQEYLNEGIDCNEDGEFAERSSGIYNVVNDRAMIMLCEEMGRDDLYEYVNRNLDMMLTYIEPDGSVFTMNSTRQDSAKKTYPDYYYELYYYMAFKFKNPLYYTAAVKIMDKIYELGRPAPESLHLFMLNPEWIDFEMEQVSLPSYYNKFFKNSGMVRIIKDNMSLSILENNPNFMFFNVGKLSCFLRIGVSFFSERHLVVQDIEKSENTYILTYKTKGEYMLPFDKKPDTSNWWEMDNSLRKRTDPINLNFKIVVSEVDKGFEMSVKTEGCDRVPIRFELGLLGGTIISGDSFYCACEPGQAIAVKSGFIKMENGLDTMIVGPAFAQNAYVKGKFGSMPKSSKHFTVYFSEFTNFDKKISLLKG